MGIVKTLDICRFQGVTALAFTTLWKPWVFGFLPVIFAVFRLCNIVLQ
jgi:hypothetical protein